MSKPVLRAEDYRSRKIQLAGWDAGVTSYKIGDEYYCEVDNANPGGRLARGKGATREAAEKVATAAAEKELAATRGNATR